MLRNFSFKVILISIILAVFANCSSSAKKEQTKDAKDAAKTEGAKEAPTKEEAKNTATATPDTAPEAPASTRGAEGAEAGPTSDKPNVGMRGADESLGKISATFPENPPGAKPGQCWIPIVTAATYKELSENVEKKAASEKVETIPAVYETVEEKVVVKPASIRVEQVPAVFETVDEKLVEREGYTEWRKDTSTGIKCLVEVPPTYKIVKKEVVKTPAASRDVEVPAEYATVSKQVIKTPASTKTIAIPAEYQTVTRNVVDKSETAEWREILCETNATRPLMTQIQTSLKTAGFDPGTTEGVVDSKTFSALKDYQKSKSLPTDDGKHINMDTVRSLGVAK